MKTGFIGLGAMGQPMAKRLHAAGLLCVVMNRSPGRAEAFARETGCLAVGHVEDMADYCEAVVLCVSADDDVIQCVEALAATLPAGSLVIDCSTVAAATARRASETLANAGIGFLDCPMSGGTEGAARGTLAIMVGGDAAHLERARPVLEAMGTRIAHMGPAGAGQAAKAVNQVMVAGINQAVCEAMAFAQEEGLPAETVIETLSAGAAGNWFLEHRGPTMVKGEFPLGFKVALHDKDLAICRDMAARHGVSLPLVEMTRLHYRRLIANGHGDDDISALYTLKKRLFEAAREKAAEQDA